MDFQKLAQLLPKTSTTWTVQDTQKWLQFTGLQNFSNKFSQLGIDGSILHTLAQEDFSNQVGVTSNIVLRKFMIWVNSGFSQFDQFVRTTKKFNVTMKAVPPSKKKIKQIVSGEKIEQEEPEQKKDKRESTYTDSRPKNQENQLIIKQCEVQHANYYSFKNKGGMMGRNNNNQILIADEFVSRSHAQIIFENQEYFIRDCGSSSGTFLRINEKKLIFNGIILQMGSNQFQVSMNDRHLIALTVIQGPNIDYTFPVPKKQKITLGRKPQNQINFPDDHHLSNVHATFFSVNGIWYVQDLGSTNGTWIRLSKQGDKSGKWKLQDKAQFKLSTNLTYQCRRNTQNRKTQKQKVSQKCISCKVAERDAIILPCKHNTYCYQCISQMQSQQCDTCNAEISEIIKIFKA